ncbi:MAG TPA: TlpA disulfide reductase family protein [Candidatus Limnocylindrales bacterium]|nr:TlpA disulfide reductase family protein [Candidatus Limnocylindrales bacterium]
MSFLRAIFGGRIMSKIQTGSPAPMFALGGIDGRQHSLADALKKGPVLAAFFKVSCPVCQLAFPFLERIYDTYGDATVSFWGVSQDTAHDTQEFLDEFGVKFPTLIDADGYKATKQYGLTNVPSIFLIQPDGKVHTASVGFAKKDLEAIAAEIAKASGKATQRLFRPDEKVPEYRPG